MNNWPKFAFTSKLTSTSLQVPGLISISYYQAYRLRKILKESYCAYIVMAHKNIYYPLKTNNLPKLLKPNKKVMLAACAGHCWQITPHNTFYSTTDNKKSTTSARKLQPIIPSLRELLLSCAINWKDFKQPLAL